MDGRLHHRHPQAPQRLRRPVGPALPALVDVQRDAARLGVGVFPKLLFASDWPVTDPDEAIASLRGFNRFAEKHHLPEVPDDALEVILQRDSLRLLGLE